MVRSILFSVIILIVFLKLVVLLELLFAFLIRLFAFVIRLFAFLFCFVTPPRTVVDFPPGCKLKPTFSSWVETLNVPGFCTNVLLFGFDLRLLGKGVRKGVPTQVLLSGWTLFTLFSSFFLQSFFHSSRVFFELHEVSFQLWYDETKQHSSVRLFELASE